MDRTKLTFSQAEGLEPLPGPLALGELSDEFRAVIWDLVFTSLKDSLRSEPAFGSTWIGAPWLEILRDLHVFHFHLPADEFRNDVEPNVKKLKRIFFSGKFNEVFDLLLAILRHRQCERKLVKAVKDGFSFARVAYKVVDDGPTIIPAASKAEGEAIAGAFDRLSGIMFSGARKHLRDASRHLNAGNFSDSVRDSIHAVESVTRTIDPKKGNSLGAALNELEKHTKIHPAFKQGLERLYGYTSAEGGVRHPLLEGEAAKVDQTDAVFMFGACASFITYLIGKSQAAGIKLD